MHVVDFSSDTPIQHLQRALDELARMGLALVDLHVTQASDRAEIRIGFACSDPGRAANYRERLIRLPGVVSCEPDRDEGDGTTGPTLGPDSASGGLAGAPRATDRRHRANPSRAPAGRHRRAGD